MSDLEAVLAILELPAEPRRVDPHPDLVAAIRPTPAQMWEAALILGWFPDDRDRPFRAAASAER